MMMVVAALVMEMVMAMAMVATTMLTILMMMVAMAVVATTTDDDGGGNGRHLELKHAGCGFLSFYLHVCVCYTRRERVCCRQRGRACSVQRVEWLLQSGPHPEVRDARVAAAFNIKHEAAESGAPILATDFMRPAGSAARKPPRFHFKPWMEYAGAVPFDQLPDTPTNQLPDWRRQKHF